MITSDVLQDYKISFPTRLAPSLVSWRNKSENRSALALGVDISVLWFPRTWISQVIPLFIFALMRNHRIAENRAAVPQKLRFNISAKEVMNKPFLMNSSKLELWCLNHISTMEKERETEQQSSSKARQKMLCAPHVHASFLQLHGCTK